MNGAADVRWGIVGPGRIAAKVVKDFRVRARCGGRGRRAALHRTGPDVLRRARLETAYGSYREIIAAPDIDALYIATPHPQHHRIAVAALQAGKAVLVEKTFTATVAGAEDIIATAQGNGVFAMEAMWTRFQPAIVLPAR